VVGHKVWGHSFKTARKKTNERILRTLAAARHEGEQESGQKKKSEKTKNRMVGAKRGGSRGGEIGGWCAGAVRETKRKRHAGARQTKEVGDENGKER